MTDKIVLHSGESQLAFDPNTGLLCQWTLNSRSQGRFDVFHPPFQQTSPIPHWPGGGCPILLPWSGRVWLGNEIGQYSWKNRVAIMPIHGFAYVAEYHLIEHSPSEIEFKLKDNALTRTAYPWHFGASVRYLISDRQLNISIQIDNLDTVDLGFAPGIHPFFRLDAIQDWTVSIPTKLAYEVNEKGLAGKSRPIKIDQNSCIQPELRSLILGDLDDHHAELHRIQQERRIRVSWDPATTHYIVLWVDRGAGYFCLEPWSGLPDAIHNGRGLVIIPPGQSQKFNYAIRI